MSPCAMVLVFVLASAVGTPRPPLRVPARSTLLAGVLHQQRAKPDPGPDRWLAEDKVRHFAMSFAVTGMAFGGARVMLDAAAARNTAVAFAALLGVGKELMDARRGGPFSLKDLAWDAAGVALGYSFVQHID